jgi:ribosomal protein S18 acetylase RimI-like enzyme
VIREYGAPDDQAVVDLSLRAWAPVFASLEQVLGTELSARLHGEWREYQADAVRTTVSTTTAWVAEICMHVAGFVAASAHAERRIGEISLVAVDPDHQGEGVGRAVTDHATDWLRNAGMRVAMVETGGDPAHGPARRLYQAAGYTTLPVARYVKAL